MTGIFVLDSSPGFTQVFTMELLKAASMNRQTHTPVLESTTPSQVQTPNPFQRGLGFAATLISMNLS